MRLRLTTEVLMILVTHIDWLLRKLAYLGFVAASVLLLVVALMGAADVISTNLFFEPIPGMVELSGSLLAVIVFLGLAQAQARGAHIVIDVATGAMGPRMKKIALIFTLAVGAAFMATVAWRTTNLAINAYGYNERALGALPFPLTPFKALAAFGAWLSAAEFARQLVIRLVTPAAVDTSPTTDTPEDPEDGSDA
ncbi:MAG: TRAP transporter small permease [Maritimibacter sp.]|uniref:TRAP transporter small permease n=1 Tax=Maritimibacter sp. TaxID=2003363 RepID=UPI001D67E382|nr:TRAP transporter small permease [Maritimibacter sp.]MBL6425899.1 TRAP transporter small permease [Maritimibacter sp.]